MKASIKLTGLAALISVASAVMADQAQIPDLPTRTVFRDISKDVREEGNRLATAELRAAYLSSVIASNSAGASEIENFRKASAIRLLGVLKQTNTIGVLVSNITFVDLRYHDKPSIEALGEIGELAVPSLLEVLKDPTATPETCECTVKALMLVKHSNPKVKDWVQFMSEQRPKLPKEAWDRLWKYGSIQD